MKIPKGLYIYLTMIIMLFLMFFMLFENSIFASLLGGVILGIPCTYIIVIIYTFLERK